MLYGKKLVRGRGVMGNRRRLFGRLSIGCSVLVGPSWAAMIELGYGELTINQEAYHYSRQREWF
jgi:hypothetical protein